ncbi:MAG: hypothetical protein KatS3mg114_1266 [Planctomycetaceae bacterium]|nr:MAG: hypothetical protein KatS3mg114_1266 [Planctomycetaceae bacterium]
MNPRCSYQETAYSGRVEIQPHPERPTWFRLHTALWLPDPLEVVFPFFADPYNLEALTPPWLHFRILTPPPVTMQAGLHIDYWLRWHGVPLRWQSEIAVWQPPTLFVDRQVRGPYRWWWHEHRFTQLDAGTLISDTVDYAVPRIPWVHRWLVQPDLRRIFEYRAKVLKQRFP